jgi:hypothetical protein
MLFKQRNEQDTTFLNNEFKHFIARKPVTLELSTDEKMWNCNRTDFIISREY